MIVVIVLLIVMSGFFSATETAFSSLNRIRVKSQADAGDKRSKLIMSLADNYDGLLSSILVGNNIVNISCTSVATVLFTYCVGEGAGPTVSTIFFSGNTRSAGASGVLPWVTSMAMAMSGCRP